MQNKIFIFIIFLFTIGCSGNDTIDTSKYENIFNNDLLLNGNGEIKLSKIGKVEVLENIFNAKSYNKTNPSVDFPLNKIWEINTHQSIDDQNPFLPEPILILSHLYLINTTGKLFKINTSNGKIIWKKEIFKDIENTVIGTPAISGRVTSSGDVILYTHSGNNLLLAIGGNDGKIIWKKNQNLPFRGGMTVFEDSLYLGDYDGNFMSLNLDNGLLNWTTYLGSDYNSVYTNARPIIAEDKIIVPTTGGTFFILSLLNGEVEWSDNILLNKQLPKIFHAGDIVANPIYDKGLIYLVSQSGNISAFDLNSSNEIWSLPVGGVETPTLSGNTIFVSGNQGILSAIDINSGKIIWKKKFQSYLNEDAIFAKRKIAIYKGPTLISSKILFAKHDGITTLIEAKNGKVLENLSTGNLALAPIPGNKKVLFLTENGYLLAYK